MDLADPDATIRLRPVERRVFDRYRLQDIVGRGSMGVVWRAIDEKLGEVAALKFLPEFIKFDELAISALKDETRRARQLTHRHIVRIHDFHEDAESAAIAMELVDGGTLAALQATRPNRIFTIAEISPWIRQLCEALEYAHAEAQLVHLDLKPANLMIDGAGRLKVGDFSIACRIADRVTRMTGRPVSGGTLAYMSPQQLMGGTPTIADDIHALGATLYELLTGEPPYRSGSIEAQILTRVPPTMARRRAELGVTGEPIPAHWEQTVAACLAKEPENRPASAGEVARLLQLTGPQAGQAPVSRPRALLQGWRRAMPRIGTGSWFNTLGPRARRAGSAAAAGIPLALLGFFLWSVDPVGRTPAGREAAPAVSPEAAGMSVTIPPMTSPLPLGGSVRLIPGRFVRDGDRFTASYEANVIPYFFLNESGRISISLTNEQISLARSGKPQPFLGEAVNDKGESRPISGWVQADSDGRGRLQAHVNAGKHQLFFDGKFVLADGGQSKS